MERKKQISIKVGEQEGIYTFLKQKEASVTEEPSLGTTPVLEEVKQEKHSLPDAYSYPSQSPHLPLSHYQKRKKQKGNWEGLTHYRYNETKDRHRFRAKFRLVLTALAAIILGIIMGMMVISIFSNLGESVETERSSRFDTVDTEKELMADPDVTQDPLTIQGEGEGAESLLLIPSGHVEGTQIQLPARSFYVVQAGAFSELNMAKEMEQTHQDKGWASILLDDSSPYRLYAGLALNREDALLLGTFYHEQNIEIYVKEHRLPATTAAISYADEQALSLLPSFLTKGDQLVSQLSKLSTAGIMNGTLSLTDADWKKMQELHRGFLQEGQAIFKGWPEERQQAGQRLQHSLTEAMEALNTYRQKQHHAYLWKMQQALLYYLQANERFLADL